MSVSQIYTFTLLVGWLGSGTWSWISLVLVDKVELMLVNQKSIFSQVGWWTSRGVPTLKWFSVCKVWKIWWKFLLLFAQKILFSVCDIKIACHTYVNFTFRCRTKYDKIIFCRHVFVLCRLPCCIRGEMPTKLIW